MIAHPASRLLAACGILGAIACPSLHAQIPAIPEPPIILYGTVTDKANNQPVTISSVTWQVSDGTTNRSYSAATLPATRIVSNGQSFYLLEVPQETRVVQNGAGQITLQPGGNGFEVKSPGSAYTLTATINGSIATTKAVDGSNQPDGTASAVITDYSPATQGRMMRVDLWINENPFNAWAVQYFGSTTNPLAAPTADPDGDGQTNEQEFAAGTDPTNGASGLRLADFSRAPTGDSFSLQWQSVAGKTYQVETCTTLAQQDWTSLGSSVTATGPITATTLPTASGDQKRFFRVKVLP